MLDGAGSVEGGLAREVALAALFALGGAVGVDVARGEGLGFVAEGEGGALDQGLEGCGEGDGWRGAETYCIWRLSLSVSRSLGGQRARMMGKSNWDLGGGEQAHHNVQVMLLSPEGPGILGGMVG